MNRMTGKSWWVCMAAALLALPVGLAGAADGEKKPERPRDGEGRGPEMVRRLLADLNLSEEQQGKVKTIMMAHHEAMQKFREENKEKFEAIREKMKKAREDKDEAAGKAAAEEFRTLIASGPGLLPLAALKEVLDAEQFAKLEKRVAEFRERGPGPGGPGGPGAPGDRPRKPAGDKPKDAPKDK